MKAKALGYEVRERKADFQGYHSDVEYHDLSIEFFVKGGGDDSNPIDLDTTWYQTDIEMEWSGSSMSPDWIAFHLTWKGRLGVDFNTLSAVVEKLNQIKPGYSQITPEEFVAWADKAGLTRLAYDPRMSNRVAAASVAPDGYRRYWVGYEETGNVYLPYLMAKDDKDARRQVSKKLLALSDPEPYNIWDDLGRPVHTFKDTDQTDTEERTRRPKIVDLETQVYNPDWMTEARKERDERQAKTAARLKEQDEKLARLEAEAKAEAARAAEQAEAERLSAMQAAIGGPEELGEADFNAEPDGTVETSQTVAY